MKFLAGNTDLSTTTTPMWTNTTGPMWTTSTMIYPADEWEEEITIIRRRKKVVPLTPCPITPTFPQPPQPSWPWAPVQPWITSPGVDYSEPCMIDEFFKNNPGSQSCMISCPCFRHRIMC